MNVKQTMKNVVLMECVSTQQGPTIVPASRDFLSVAMSVKASNRLASQRKVDQEVVFHSETKTSTWKGRGCPPYRSARCKLLAFLVSLRVFRTKCHYFKLSKYRFGLTPRNINKKRSFFRFKTRFPLVSRVQSPSVVYFPEQRIVIELSALRIRWLHFMNYTDPPALVTLSPSLANTALLRTEGTSSPEATEKCMETTPTISEFRSLHFTWLKTQIFLVLLLAIGSSLVTTDNWAE